MSAHLDTVTPGIGIEPVIENGIIRSKGDTILGSDDKAGIAAMVEAIETAIEQELPMGDLELLLTIAEEGGLNGSRNMDYSLVDSKYAFVFDSGGAPGEIMIQVLLKIKLKSLLQDVQPMRVCVQKRALVLFKLQPMR